MRSGGLDRLVTFTRPGAPVRDGRSRVSGPPETIAANVPCRIEAGEGAEEYANAETAATTPAVFTVRAEPDLERLTPGDLATDDRGRVYDIKAVRPHPRDPRRDLEIRGVANA